MRFSVDPWDPAYGTSVDPDPGDSTAEVAVDVELPGAPAGGPLDPPGRVDPPAAVRFVDGVRRVDAQVWVRRAGRHRLAGAVRLVRGRGGLLLRRRGPPGRRAGAARAVHHAAAGATS